MSAQSQVKFIRRESLGKSSAKVSTNATETSSRQPTTTTTRPPRTQVHDALTTNPAADNYLTEPPTDLTYPGPNSRLITAA